MSSQHSIRLAGSRFWITHRGKEYGPFDYEWSADFLGLELHFAGEKFGEYCSAEEFFADLKPFRLPWRVVQVASIVIGSIVRGTLQGMGDAGRNQFVADQLAAFGQERFEICVTTPPGE